MGCSLKLLGQLDACAHAVHGRFTSKWRVLRATAQVSLLLTDGFSFEQLPVLSHDDRIGIWLRSPSLFVLHREHAVPHRYMERLSETVSISDARYQTTSFRVFDTQIEISNNTHGSGYMLFDTPATSSKLADPKRMCISRTDIFICAPAHVIQTPRQPSIPIQQ